MSGPYERAHGSPAAADELEAALAAHALGALPEPDAQAVERHVATCPACRTQARELVATVALLPAACEPAEPTPALRDRVLAAARAAIAPDPALLARTDGAQLASTAEPTVWRIADPPDLAPQTGTDSPPGAAPPPARRPAIAWRPWLLTAAAVLLAVGVGLSNVLLRQDLRERDAVLAVYESAMRSWPLEGDAAPLGARATLVQPRAGGSPVLIVQTLPELPATRAYQVWMIRDGQPASAAVLPRGGEAPRLVELGQPLAGAQTVALTEEPAGGSPAPTGPILLATSL